MKLYTFTFDLAAPIKQRFQTPQRSDFKVGVKVVNGGEPVEGELSLLDGGTPLAPDAQKTDEFTTWTLKSGKAGEGRTYKVEVAGSPAVFELSQAARGGTVFEVGSGSGGDSPAADAYRETTYDTKVVYQDTENRTFVLSSFTFEGEVTREDIPMPDGFPVREIIFGTGVSAVGDNACSGLVGL